MMRSSKSKTKLAVNQRWAFEAIGTHWVIDIVAKPGTLASLKPQISQRIEEFDAAYSRFRPDSLMTRISQAAGEYKLPDDASPLLQLYQQMYHATAGAVSPLIGQVLADAGYDATYSLQPQSLKNPPTWEYVLAYKEPILYLKQPALLDFGAAGKGYLVDIISRLLEESNATSYCVDAGGDMRASGQAAPLRVGLENPDNPKQVIGFANLANRSLCGSAGNRRKWGVFTHIINPHTLQSPKNIKAVWTVANSTLLADGMATCLFFTPPEELLVHFDFEYLVVSSDNSAIISPGFPGELF